MKKKVNETNQFPDEEKDFLVIVQETNTRNENGETGRDIITKHLDGIDWNMKERDGYYVLYSGISNPDGLIERLLKEMGIVRKVSRSRGK